MSVKENLWALENLSQVYLMTYPCYSVVRFGAKAFPFLLHQMQLRQVQSWKLFQYLSLLESYLTQYIFIYCWITWNQKWTLNYKNIFCNMICRNAFNIMWPTLKSCQYRNDLVWLIIFQQYELTEWIDIAYFIIE